MSLPVWALLTLDDAKQHVKAEDSTDDALIERAIVAATRYVERYTGRLFVRRSVTEEIPGGAAVGAGRILRLGWRPVISVESVAIDGEPVTDYRADRAWARLIREVPWPDGSTVTVQYTAGHAGQAADLADEFADVLQAARLLIGHWYEHREAVAVGTVTQELELSVRPLLAPYRVVRL